MPPMCHLGKAKLRDIRLCFFLAPGVLSHIAQGRLKQSQIGGPACVSLAENSRVGGRGNPVEAVVLKVLGTQKLLGTMRS